MLYGRGYFHSVNFIKSVSTLGIWCSEMHRINRYHRITSVFTRKSSTIGNLIAGECKVAMKADWKHISDTESALAAVQAMVKYNVGSLIVREKGSGVVGIVTERDILTRIPSTRKLDLDVTVSSIMSKRIMCIETNTTLMDAMASMAKRKTRHFAVIHENMSADIKNDIVPESAMRCVLSVRDIVQAFAFELSSKIESTETKEESTDLGLNRLTKVILQEKHRNMKFILNTRVDDDITVAEAVEQMTIHNVGAVVVVDEEHSIRGIFTERDYLRRIVHEQLDPASVFLSKVCTKDVKCINLKSKLLDCVHFAANNSFRHFPIVDDSATICGILSIKDIVDQVSKGYDSTPGFWLMEYFRPSSKKAKQTKSRAVVKDESPKEG